MSDKKNIYIMHFHGDTTPFAPLLWPSAKTYFERQGKHLDKFNWVLPLAEIYSDIEIIKQEIRKAPPSLFGVGLYVWNFELSLEICKWVKEEFPDCYIVTGGPHQYWKHNKDWFVKHNFIDASLASEVYGEIAIYDMLCELAENEKIDWNKVERAAFPLSFDRSCYLESPKSTYKKEFNWDFSAYAEQKEHIKTYVNYWNNYWEEQKKKLAFGPRKGGPSMFSHGIHWKLETTRGCPYSCTFCDWGGGVSSKVVLKSMDSVQKDIDTMLSLQKELLIYVCDANFGINRERDVAVIKYMAKSKKQHNATIDLHYGGYAKTNSHFDTLLEIFNVEAENLMSNHYKISIQSFHEDVLKNIKRTDLRKEEHWRLSDYLKKKYKYDSFVELIIGLPGHTVEKWCEEFSVCYEKNTVARAYEWHLLPESEGYDPKYREKFKIGTSKKLMNDSQYHIPAEYVVESFSYTRQDYKIMWIIFTAYELFFRGGIYKKTIKNLLKTRNMTFGQLLKSFYYNCYLPMANEPKYSETDTSKQIKSSFDYFEEHLNYLVDDGVNNKYKYAMDINFKGEDYQIFFTVFLLLEYFFNYDYMDKKIQDWLLSLGADKKLIDEDNLLILNEERVNTRTYKINKIVSYKKYKTYQEYLNELNILWLYTCDTLIGDEYVLFGNKS